MPKYLISQLIVYSFCSTLLLVEANSKKDGKKMNRYQVNFTSDLSATLAEVKHLEKLGFTVPDVARNMSIQVYSNSSSMTSITSSVPSIL